MEQRGEPQVGAEARGRRRARYRAATPSAWPTSRSRAPRACRSRAPARCLRRSSGRRRSPRRRRTARGRARAGRGRTRRGSATRARCPRARRAVRATSAQLGRSTSLAPLRGELPCRSVAVVGRAARRSRRWRGRRPAGTPTRSRGGGRARTAPRAAGRRRRVKYWRNACQRAEIGGSSIGARAGGGRGSSGRRRRRPQRARSPRCRRRASTSTASVVVVVERGRRPTPSRTVDALRRARGRPARRRARRGAPRRRTRRRRAAAARPRGRSATTSTVSVTAAYDGSVRTSKPERFEPRAARRW